MPGNSAAVWLGVDAEEGSQASTSSHYGLVLGESIAKRVNAYQELVTEYNAAIQEAIEAKGG